MPSRRRRGTSPFAAVATICDNAGVNPSTGRGLRVCALCALLSLVACVPVLRGGRALDEATLARGVTIVRDEWGVPSIYGPDDASVAFGAAFAQAEDAYWQIEEDYIQALGRASAYYGERHLAADVLIAALDVERLSREEYAREPADRRDVWDAFALGLNYYLRVSGLQPRLISRWEPWMLFARYRGHVAERALAHVQLDSTGLRIQHRDSLAARDASRVRAVSGARSAGGQMLVVQSIDAAFVGRGQMYEMHLHSESGWHVRGFALLGTPIPHAGHNEHTAWLVLHDREAGLDAEVSAIVEVVDTLRVNAADGVVPRVVRLRRSTHGAVVTGPDGRPHALFIPYINRGGAAQLLHQISHATTVAAFTAAVENNSLETEVSYADAAGNILYVSSNSVVQALEGSFDNRTGSAIEGDSLTLERLVALAWDTHLAGITEPIAALVTEWEEVGGSNPDRAMRLDAAIALLRNWDGNATQESTAATLYVLWRERARQSGYSGSLARLRAFEDVVARLQSDWRTAEVPWGEMQRLQRLPADAGMAFSDALPSLPARGAPAWTGAAMVVETVPAAQGRQRYAVRGNIIQAVELGARPRTLSLTAFGQSADPQSPVHLDQAPLYARGELKSAWFTREDVTAHARRTYRPAESVTVPRSH
jgi:acyl-homoserine lactone acylase PvdQ